MSATRKDYRVLYLPIASVRCPSLYFAQAGCIVDTSSLLSTALASSPRQAGRVHLPFRACHGEEGITTSSTFDYSASPREVAKEASTLFPSPTSII